MELPRELRDQILTLALVGNNGITPRFSVNQQGESTICVVGSNRFISALLVSKKLKDEALEISYKYNTFHFGNVQSVLSFSDRFPAIAPRLEHIKITLSWGANIMPFYRRLPRHVRARAAIDGPPPWCQEFVFKIKNKDHLKDIFLRLVALTHIEVQVVLHPNDEHLFTRWPQKGSFAVCNAQYGGIRTTHLVKYATSRWALNSLGWSQIVLGFVWHLKQMLDRQRKAKRMGRTSS